MTRSSSGMEQQWRLFTGPDGKLQLPTLPQQTEPFSTGAYGHSILYQPGNPAAQRSPFVTSPLPSSSPPSSSSTTSSTSSTPPISYLPHRDVMMTSAFSVPHYSPQITTQVPYQMHFFPPAPATPQLSPTLQQNPNEVIQQLNERQQATANEQAVRAQRPVEPTEEKKDRRLRGVAKSSSETTLQVDALLSEPQQQQQQQQQQQVASPILETKEPKPVKKPVQKKEKKRRTASRETLRVGNGQYTVRNKELEPKISSNKELDIIMATNPNVTDMIFSELEQVYRTKVVLYKNYFVALTDVSQKINKPKITDGSKRPKTQHNEKLKNKGFYEKRLGKAEPGGRTYFVKKSHP